MSVKPTKPLANFVDEDLALACVHCGLCLGACPTYLETGLENDSPRGRIYLMRAAQRGEMPLEGEVQQRLDRCLGCRACETACPSGVQYGALLESSRDYLEHHTKRPLSQRLLRRWMIERVFPYPSRLKLATAPARVMKRLGLGKLAPRFVRDALKLIPSAKDSDPIKEFYPATGERRGSVGMITGCVMSAMFSKTHQSTIDLLNAVGYDVYTPTKQGCCGALSAHSGQLNQAREFARANIRVFDRLAVTHIIINAAGCGSTLKEYAHLLDEDLDYKFKAAEFTDKIKDITEFLAEPESFNCLKNLLRPINADERVTYHDACHLAHAQSITTPPRQLVRLVAPNGFIELPEADVCCGSAGSYNLTEPEMANRLGRRKAQHIASIQPTRVITSNPGCILQMRAATLEQAGSESPAVQHIVDFLAERLPNVGSH